MKKGRGKLELIALEVLMICIALSSWTLHVYEAEEIHVQAKVVAVSQTDAARYEPIAVRYKTTVEYIVDGQIIQSIVSGPGLQIGNKGDIVEVAYHSANPKVALMIGVPAVLEIVFVMGTLGSIIGAFALLWACLKKQKA